MKKRAKQSNPQAQAPLPVRAIGTFLVLARDKELAHYGEDFADYILHMESETNPNVQNSYNLGNDAPTVARILRRYTPDQYVAEMIVDIATSFGASQYVYHDDRIIPLKAPTKDVHDALRPQQKWTNPRISG